MRGERANGDPKHGPSARAKAVIAYRWQHPGRRSSHSSQKPRVMPGTGRRGTGPGSFERKGGPNGFSDPLRMGSTAEPDKKALVGGIAAMIGRNLGYLKARI